ncbi:MAG: hypothetical protein WDN46_14400 [Methylocella sp.]
MPKPRWPFLQKQTTRHGATVWYVRKGKGRRTRIKEKFGTLEFEEAYYAAVAGKMSASVPVESESLTWLVDRYKEASEWTRLSSATQSQRGNIYKVMLKSAGKEPFAAITEEVIIDSRDWPAPMG